MPLDVFRRTVTRRSQRGATGFTPVAVLLFVLVANGEAINLQQHDPDSVPWLSIATVLIGMIGSADCLVRLALVPAGSARWSRLLTIVLVTLLLSSAFFGPFTFGIVRWAAIVIGVPWAVLLWLTVRELARLLTRRPSSPAPSSETLSVG